MNYLTDEKYIRAWAESFVQAKRSSQLLAGNLREAYERATRVPFSQIESAVVREHLIKVCTELFGARCEQGNADESTLVGVAFRPAEKMYGKPVLYVAAKTIINFKSAFNHKGGLSSAGAGNTGTACAFECTYCSTPAGMNRNPQTRILEVLGLPHADVVIRRLNAVETARRQLVDPDGKPIYNDPDDKRILELASIVDPLPNTELMEETYELVETIFALTPWRVRILTKSGLLARFARRFSETDRNRLLLGFSIGIPEDDVARTVEKDTTAPSTRFRIHRELLEEGFTMFGMSCPVLAVSDFMKLAEQIAVEIQPERLERVWCEVINRRGASLIKTIASLKQGGFHDLAARMAKVASSEILWELEYNRKAFLAFSAVMPPGKLAYLSYVTPKSEMWWSDQVNNGAILL